MAAGQGPRPVPRTLGAPAGLDATGGHVSWAIHRCQMGPRPPAAPGGRRAARPRAAAGRAAPDRLPALPAAPDAPWTRPWRSSTPPRRITRRGPTPRRSGPALARQIRESRRPALRTGLAPVRALGRPGPGLGLLAAAVAAWVARLPGRAERPDPPWRRCPSRRRRRPLRRGGHRAHPARAGRVGRRARAGRSVDYDLDHGTPMGPDTRDAKASY